MSDIVNVGIQQNGIEHASPDAISEKGMTFLQTFMSEDERQLLKENYTLVSGTDKDDSGTLYSDLYPDLGTEMSGFVRIPMKTPWMKWI